MHQTLFSCSLEAGEERKPVDLHETWISFIGLELIAFLALNPFLALFMLSFYLFFVNDSLKLSKLSLIILAFAFAIFYSSRNIGVEWSSGSDDVPRYIASYLRDQELSFSTIISRFILVPKDNEVLYFLPAWLIGKLFNAGPETFVFLNYLGQLTLLSVIAYLVSRRYAVLFIFVFFFGIRITDVNPSILSMWRASFSLLVFMTGILIYYKRNMKIGQIIVFSSVGFHVSMLVGIFIFELYNILKRKTGFYMTVALGALIAWLSAGFFEKTVANIYPEIDKFYVYAEGGQISIFLQAIVLVVLLAANYFYKLSAVGKYATFMFATYFALQLQYSDNTRLLSRLNQIIIPVIAISLFEILMKQKKALILFIISLLFIRTVLRPDLELFSIMIPEYREPFYGVLNIFLRGFIR